MNKRCAMTAVAVFVTMAVLEFLVHGVLLKEAYQATASVWRPMEEMHGMMWLMWVIYLVNALVLPYIYVKGYEAGKSPIGQGLRFGLEIGVLLSTGMSLGTYFMIPVPVSLAATWFVAGMIEYAVVGVVIGALYKPEPA